jgi:hypothetical protein
MTKAASEEAALAVRLRAVSRRSGSLRHAASRSTNGQELVARLAFDAFHAVFELAVGGP